jgi:cytochrome b561
MIAKTVHYLLYLSIFVLIFAGWGMSSWGGHSVPFWGKTNWALPVAVNLNISHSLQAVHYWGAWALFTLIILHLIAALYHQLILRDNLISTMWRQKTRRLFK